MGHNHCNCDNNSVSLVTGIILGGAVGALLGMLFTPNDGATNREKARVLSKDVLDKSMEKAKPYISKAKDELKEKASSAKSKAGEKFTEIRSRFDSSDKATTEEE